MTLRGGRSANCECADRFYLTSRAPKEKDPPMCL